jgi:hypothetical protein
VVVGKNEGQLFRQRQLLRRTRQIRQAPVQKAGGEGREGRQERRAHLGKPGLEHNRVFLRHGLGVQKRGRRDHQAHRLDQSQPCFVDFKLGVVCHRPPLPRHGPQVDPADRFHPS